MHKTREQRQFDALHRQNLRNARGDNEQIFLLMFDRPGYSDKELKRLVAKRVHDHVSKSWKYNIDLGE